MWLGVNGGKEFRARSVKPFGGGRPGLRRTRALWKFNCGKERCGGVPGLRCGAQQLRAWVEKKVGEKNYDEKRSY